MTRINCIPAVELTDKHLVAEYRELPRVFALARRARPREARPASYTLGTGHVLFFYDKLEWLTKRHAELVSEMRRRGFTVNFPVPPAHPDRALYGDWVPTDQALKVNRRRIRVRLREAKQRRAVESPATGDPDCVVGR